jgi:hypothetical protein
MTELRIRAVENIDMDCIDVAFIKKEDGQKYAGRIAWEPIETFPVGTRATFSVDSQSAHPLQRLVDDLYACGIRPTAAKGSAGQLDAVNRHLEDMRTLVFKREQP